MGRPKATLELDGQTLVGRVVTALRTAGADPVVVVGGPAADAEAISAAHVPDRWPGEGPLGGIVTAVDTLAASDIVVVMACDLADPDPDAISRVVEVLTGGDGDVAVPVLDHRQQWLHAAWRSRAQGHLDLRFRAGDRAVAAAVDGLVVTTVDDVGPEALADIDDAAAWERRSGPSPG